MDKVLLFDIDGTLINSDGAGKLALTETFKELYDIDIFDAGIKFAGHTDLAIYDQVQKMFDLDLSGFDDIMQLFVKKLTRTIKEKRGYVIPGAKEILNFLSPEKDLLLGLLTGNIYDGAKIKLEHFDLFDYFSFGVFGDVALEREELARFALRRLAHLYNRIYRGEDVYIIGDTVYDIRCGKAIDATTIAVCTGYHDRETLAKEKPDYIMDSLEDVQFFIKLLK